jgi:two-component system cell cycle sensor histidine kinase/response regulator CckA
MERVLMSPSSNPAPNAPKAAAFRNEPTDGSLPSAESLAASLRKTQRALRMLQRCTHELVHAIDESALLNEICRIAVEQGGYGMAWIGLADPGTATPMRVAGVAGVTGDRFLDSDANQTRIGSGWEPAATAIRTGQPSILREFSASAAFVPWENGISELSIRSAMAVPLKVGANVLGAISVYSCESPAFDADEIALLADFGSNLAFGILALRSRQTQEETERAMVESEFRYRQLFESNPHPMWVYDRETLAFLAVNNAAVDRYGYSHEEFLGMTIADIRPPEDVPRLREAVARVRPGLNKAESWRHRRKDGTLIDVEITSHTLEFMGRPAEVILAHDITQRRKAESQLLKLSAAVVASADGILITDAEGNVEWVNPAFSKVTGYTLDEAAGKNPRFLKSGEQDEAFYRAFWRTIASGKTWSGRVRNRRKDGSHYTEEMTVAPVRDDAGDICHYIAIKRDITEREKLERQLQQAQKMEAVGQLAGGVAHDFNNLLTVINGFSEMVLASLPADSPYQMSINAIHDAGVRAASLTRQLLAFSRQSVLTPKLLDLNMVVQETQKMLRRLIGEDIALSTDLEPNLDCVKVDPGQISQVLINLAVNARDAMPKGGTLRLSTRSFAAGPSDNAPSGPGRYIVLSMTDSGCGMSADVKARIFEPFFTTKEVGKGTGLGLAMVYGIVQQSGGSIEVDSEVGVGTTIRMMLPAARDMEPERPPAEPAKPARGGETVLLVEDEEAVLALAHYALATNGYRVLCASNAAEALRLAAAHPEIDLLCSDVVMPGQDGRELAEQLKRTHPTTKVMFVSGHMDDAVLRHGIQQAEVAFLQKPYTPQSLAAKIRQVLDGAA